MTETPWERVTGSAWLEGIYEKALERRHLESLPAPKHLLVRFVREGDLTIALVRGPHRRKPESVIVDGSSRKSSRDPERPEVGMAVAMTRALEKLNNELF